MINMISFDLYPDNLPAMIPSDCLVSMVLGIARDSASTRPELVPTHNEGQVLEVSSMKVQAKWRHLTRLPSSANTLLSGRHESVTSFSGMRGALSLN